MTDDIPEDANIYFCAAKKSVYVTRDIVKGIAEGMVYAAIFLMVLMVGGTIAFVLRYHLKTILDFIISIPIVVYIIVGFTVGVYLYSLLWCYDRKSVLEMKKVCLKYGIDSEVFETFGDWDRVYIQFNQKYKGMKLEIGDTFNILYKGETCAVGSNTLYQFVEKIKFFERNNIPITAEADIMRGTERDGWEIIK